MSVYSSNYGPFSTYQSGQSAQTSSSSNTKSRTASKLNSDYAQSTTYEHNTSDSDDAPISYEHQERNENRDKSSTEYEQNRSDYKFDWRSEKPWYSGNCSCCEEYGHRAIDCDYLKTSGCIFCNTTNHETYNCRKNDINFLSKIEYLERLQESTKKRGVFLDPERPRYQHRNDFYEAYEEPKWFYYYTRAIATKDRIMDKDSWYEIQHSRKRKNKGNKRERYKLPALAVAKEEEASARATYGSFSQTSGQQSDQSDSGRTEGTNFMDRLPPALQEELAHCLNHAYCPACDRNLITFTKDSETQTSESASSPNPVKHLQFTDQIEQLDEVVNKFERMFQAHGDSVGLIA